MERTGSDWRCWIRIRLCDLSCVYLMTTSCSSKWWRTSQTSCSSLTSLNRMSLPCVRRCSRHLTAGLQVCGYATVSKPSRPEEKNSSGPVFQYVGQHRKPSHKVFVWGFSFTGALGIPSFVVPDSGRKKPRKYQLTPYRLETAEQVNLQSFINGFMFRTCQWLLLGNHHMMHFESDQTHCCITAEWKIICALVSHSSCSVGPPVETGRTSFGSEHLYCPWGVI